MYSKIIFVLATVCVINASVITFKVYSDDPGIEVASNAKDCNSQACDQLCRRFHFHGGTCVNGRCKCDRFLDAEVVSEENQTDLEDFTSLKDVKASPSRCNFKGCDSLCRSLNKGSGTCIKGRCKCENSLITEEKVPEESLSSSEDSVVQDDNDNEADTKKSSCNNQACDQFCRSLKFTGGVCVNGHCKCDNFLNAEACRSDKCNELCIKLNLNSGACFDGCCVCNKRLSQKDTITDSADTPALRYCNSIECNDQCRRSGWHSGVCINGQCKCDYFRYSQDEVSEKYLPVSELSEDSTERRCDSRVCHQFCQSLKLPGGVCANGRCKCEHGTEVDAVEEYLDFATRHVCRLTKCNRTCTRRGYAGGKCVNERCKCYDKIQRQDASPLNDVTSDKNLKQRVIREESNEILSNEEELSYRGAAPSVCNVVSCSTCTVFCLAVSSDRL